MSFFNKSVFSDKTLKRILKKDKAGVAPAPPPLSRSESTSASALNTLTRSKGKRAFHVMSFTAPTCTFVNLMG